MRAAGIEVRHSTATDEAGRIAEIHDVDAAIVREGLSAAAIDAAPRLAVISNHGTGTDKIAVAHAHACGIPVVASRVGGIPEVLPEFAGVLVPARDPAALSAALLEATGRPWQGERIVEHARGFRWDDNVDRLERVLRDVVDRRA